MATAFLIIQIIISITIIALVLLQVKGSGLGGSIFGGDSSVQRTRRGVEKTIYHATIIISILFFLISLVSVVLAT